MDFSEYQVLASTTDQQKRTGKDSLGLLIPLLGLAGETGSLLSEYKKKVRDGQVYEGFDERAKEEIGDILWYVSNVATRLGISLDQIAKENIRKTQERWPIEKKFKRKKSPLDDDYPDSEKLPRKALIRIYEEVDTGFARMEWVGNRCIIIGDKLKDNSYFEDGYRFHDVMHLAHWAVLGWSPVIRRMLGKKRKSKPDVDEIEDGARAAIIEELIIAYIYNNAVQHALYEGARHLDSEMLATVKRIVQGLEVGKRLTSQWEDAIMQGYAGYRKLKVKKDVTFEIDMQKGMLRVKK